MNINRLDNLIFELENINDPTNLDFQLIDFYKKKRKQLLKEIKLEINKKLKQNLNFSMNKKQKEIFEKFFEKQLNK